MSPAYIFLFIAFLLSAIMGMIIIPRILFLSHKHKLYDIPDERKIHKTPVPRLGGLTFFPVITITISFLMAVRYIMGYDVIQIPERIVLIEFLCLLAGACILYIIGVGDDLIGISYRSKFMAQILCGLLLAISGLWLHDREDDGLPLRAYREERLCRHAAPRRRRSGHARTEREGAARIPL